MIAAPAERPNPWLAAASYFENPLELADFDPVAQLIEAGLHVWDRCQGDCADRCGGWEPAGGGTDLEDHLRRRAAAASPTSAFDFDDYGQIATQGDVLRAMFALALRRPELAPHIQLEIDVAELYVHGSPGAGKSHIAAAGSHMWLKLFVPSWVLDTSHDFRQVKYQHWKYFRRLAPVLAPDRPPPNKTEWEITPGHGALGFSSTDGGAAKGFHEAAQLYLVNEGDACGDYVFEAATRLLTGDRDLLLVLCNTFWRNSVTCDRLENRQGTHLRLDATDFIAYQEAHPSQAFPGASSRRWLDGPRSGPIDMAEGISSTMPTRGSSRSRGGLWRSVPGPIR